MSSTAQLVAVVDVEQERELIAKYVYDHGLSPELYFLSNEQKKDSKVWRGILDEIVQRHGVDVVLIATEPLSHFEYSMWALDRELHILLDKPISTAESFERIRKLFECASKYIYQSIISNRKIAIVRFEEGISTTLGMINYLELSDQKPDNSQKEGFDHIEAYPKEWSYEDMVHQFEKTETAIKVERPHHTTHDIDIGEGFLFRCTQGPLIEKIKSVEMT